MCSSWYLPSQDNILSHRGACSVRSTCDLDIIYNNLHRATLKYISKTVAAINIFTLRVSVSTASLLTSLDVHSCMSVSHSSGCNTCSKQLKQGYDYFSQSQGFLTYIFTHSGYSCHFFLSNQELLCLDLPFFQNPCASSQLCVGCGSIRRSFTNFT